MRALAGYILSGRPQAIGITSLFGLLSLVFPPAAYLLGGVPLALVTLRIGPVAGLQVMLGALVVITLGLLIAGIPPVLGLSLVLGIWIPVIFCAAYLRRSQSQAVMLLAAAAVAAGFVAMLHFMVGDVSEWWRGQLQPHIERLLADRQDVSAEQLMEGMMPFVNGMVASGLVLSLAITVMLARWLQAMLYNPGGFGEEFRALLLPRWLVLVTMVALAGAILMENVLAAWLKDLVFVAMTLFLFQGLALCHLQVKVRGWATHWLGLMYVLLLLLPQFILFVASMGFADAWLRRGRGLGAADEDNDGDDRRD